MSNRKAEKALLAMHCQLAETESQASPLLTAFNEGFDAAEEGKPVTNNPYPSNVITHQEWQNGYMVYRSNFN